MTSYRANRDRADACFPAIEEAIRLSAGKTLSMSIAPSDEESDRKRVTDYVITCEIGPVAARVRFLDNDYLKRTGARDFTIRATSNGYDTEIHKIKQSPTTLYLYGWMPEEGGRSFDSYIVVDLIKMRSAGMFGSATMGGDIDLEDLEQMLNPLGWRWMSNGDGTSFFYIPARKLIESGFVVYSYGIKTSRQTTLV